MSDILADTWVLQEMMRSWYDGVGGVRAGMLVFEDNVLKLGRNILAERCEDGTIVVNAFHWPGSEDQELVALLEVLPWHHVAFVSEPRQVDSLANLLASHDCVRTFDRVVVHESLGVGPVVSVGENGTTCMFSGTLRTFATSILERRSVLTHLQSLYRNEDIQQESE